MNGLFRTAAKILEGQKIMNPISLILYSMGFRKQISFFFHATRFRIFTGYILKINPYLGIQKWSLCLFRGNNLLHVFHHKYGYINGNMEGENVFILKKSL